MSQTVHILCPVYREEESIAEFHTKLSSVIEALPDRFSYRVVYVLDPSSDRTEQILAEISRDDQRVELLVLSRRFGHQLSLTAGIDYCRGDAIVMLDCDLQHPPELIPQLIQIWLDGADIVQCVRRDAAETGPLRRRLSRWFYRTFLHIGDVELPVGAADYRLITKRVADVLRTQIGEHNPFLRGLVSWIGFKIVYVPFTPLSRKFGRSKYRASSLMNLAFSGICSFSKVPLRFCIGAGGIIAAMSIISAIVQLTVYFVGHYDVPGWASLLVTLSFIGGMQLVFLGVVGEYVGLIFDEVKNRPRYIVDRLYKGGQSHEVNGP